MSNLIDELLSKLEACHALSHRGEFSDIETIRSLDGREIGAFQAFSGAEIEKVAIARFALGPTAAAEYSYIRVIPASRYRTPQLAFEAMTNEGTTTFSVDLYPAIDLALDVDYFARYHALLDDVYTRACASGALPWCPSSIAWARAIESPYFYMATTEDQGAIRDLVLAYLTAWCAFQASEEAVGPEVEALIRRRHDLAVDGLLAWDPNGQMLVNLLGKELFTRVCDAMLRV